MLELLHKAYPDFSIVCAVPSNCDLRGYARAGHAGITRESDELFDATRIRKSPGPRLPQNPGTLADDVRFGRYK
jgi:transitional endoplasmic reticulum ATPase